jgi:hypothetical protein
VDVWAFYKDGQLVRQDEDLNFNGRISARYYFKDGKVIKEEKVARTAVGDFRILFLSPRGTKSDDL